MRRNPDKSLARRTFLRGLGACVALPMLESLMPGHANADEQLPPKRLLYYYIPNGFDMTSWAPTGTGSSYTLSEMLSPLEPYKEDLLFLSGLDNAPGNYIPGQDAPAGAHYQQTGAFLTCTHIHQNPFGAGKSIDQVAAEALGYVTPHRSLSLGLHPGGLTGTCSSNWPCSYLGFISWADAQTPIAKLNDPVALFTTLFSQGAGLGEAEFYARKAQKLKVLDVVNEDAKALRDKLGVSDRQKLEQYLTAVNEAEDKTQALTYGLSCEPGDPPAAPSTYEEKLELMADMMALAFQCDLTRVITFMSYSGGASHGVAYDWVQYQGAAITDPKHYLSHHGGDPAKLGKLAAINQWEVARFASLVSKLKERTDFDGSSILDNSIAMFSSEISDPDSHSANDLPIIIAGKGQGTILTDRHLAYAAPENVYADLHIGLLEAFGVDIPSFGDDGTHALPGLGG